MAALATCFDAALRLRAADVPSMLSRHYAGGHGGDYDGPLRPYGIEMRQFGAESALFLLTEPRLVLVRTQVLDYFEQQRSMVKADHVLFRWERSMEVSAAEDAFIAQICLEVKDSLYNIQCSDSYLH